MIPRVPSLVDRTPLTRLEDHNTVSQTVPSKIVIRSACIRGGIRVGVAPPGQYQELALHPLLAKRRHEEPSPRLHPLSHLGIGHEFGSVDTTPVWTGRAWKVAFRVPISRVLYRLFVVKYVSKALPGAVVARSRGVAPVVGVGCAVGREGVGEGLILDQFDLLRGEKKLF